MTGGTVTGPTGADVRVSDGDSVAITGGEIVSNSAQTASSEMLNSALRIDYMDATAQPVTIGSKDAAGPTLQGAMDVVDGKIVQCPPISCAGQDVATTFESCTLHPQVQRDDYVADNPDVYSDAVPFGNLFWILGEDYPSTYYIIQVGAPPTMPATTNDSYTIVAAAAASAQQAIDAIGSGSAVVTDAPTGASATFTVSDPDVTLTVAEGVEGVTVKPAAESLAVYRLYNRYDHQHLYTTDPVEKAELESGGWTVDFGGQPAWYAPDAGSEAADYEVIRLYNKWSGDHYFVPASDTDQIDELLDLGWTKDSSASSIWSAAPEDGNVEVYTLFNPYADVDTHLWTTQKSEVDFNETLGWEQNTTTMWGVVPTEA